MQTVIARGFIVDDGLDFGTPGPIPVLRIRGRIRCQHRLFVDVDKTLEMRLRENQSKQWEVRTRKYAYQAGIDGDPPRLVFRYDNAHPYPGHDDAHHCHRFDPANGFRPIQPPEWIGYARWPHLRGVIDELEDWWNDNHGLLGLEPDWFCDVPMVSQFASPLEEEAV